jgi:hypothetical protein
LEDGLLINLNAEPTRRAKCDVIHCPVHLASINPRFGWVSRYFEVENVGVTSVCHEQSFTAIQTKRVKK